MSHIPCECSIYEGGPLIKVTMTTWVFGKFNLSVQFVIPHYRLGCAAVLIIDSFAKQGESRVFITSSQEEMSHS